MTTIPLKKFLNTDAADAHDPSAFFAQSIAGDEWFKEKNEGQLAVDVHQTKDMLIITAPIAGVRPEDLDISIHNDMITIRGKRNHSSAIADEDYFYRECYWGSFSRSIILPTDVKADMVEATLKHGILTILLPKATTARLIKVRGIEE